MDKKLRGLFGYQKFEGNSKLDKLISETESRVGVELNDNELDMVNAAVSRQVVTARKKSALDEKK